MPDLTLETALADFPEECKAVVGVRVILDTRGLAYAALEWLAGKETRTQLKRVKSLIRIEPGMEEWFHWPADPLRWLLEEVREQLKQEKEHD